MKNKVIKFINSTFVLSSPVLALVGSGCHNKATTKIIVKFDTQGGSIVADAEVNADGKVIRPEDPTKPGYHFINWYTTSSCTDAPFNFNTKITQSMTLYAKWTINSCTVIFDTQGGSEIASQEVELGGTATKPKDPTKTGVKFGGWYKNQECTGSAFDFTTEITESIILYAKWNELADCTVTFDSNGGSEVKPITVKEGETILQPANPTKEDCQFIQWNDEQGKKFDFATPITSNITLYAQWQTATTVSVTFDSRGGSEVTTQYIKKGETAKRPTDPTKTNYKFVNWYKDGVVFDFTTTPITSDITLYAEWRETVTELKIKGTIPNVVVGETTNWKIEDYIEVVPSTAPIQDLELVLTITDKDYIEDKNHQLKIISIPEDKTTYSIKVRSVDNPNVSINMTIPYTQLTTSNLEICIANGDGTFGVRAKDKSQIDESLQIPASITLDNDTTYYIGSIADRGFAGCTNLKNLTFAANDKFTVIGTSAFANCQNLSDIQLPDTTTWIGNKAFLIDDESAVPTLQSITLPSHLIKIDENSFRGQTALESITIPKTVTEIWSCAFYSCKSLKTVVIPDNSEIKFIGNMAFANCSSLESISKLPKTFVKDVEQSKTTGLGNGVFANCINLAEIGVDFENPTYKVFGNLTYGMALAAWYTLDGITYHELICYPKATGELTISDDWDLNSLGSGCFAGTTITKFHLPNTLLRMKSGVFSGCTTIQQLFLGEHYSEWKWDGATRVPPFLSDEEEAKRSINVNIAQSAESLYYNLIRY